MKKYQRLCGFLVVLIISYVIIQSWQGYQTSINFPIFDSSGNSLKKFVSTGKTVFLMEFSNMNLNFSFIQEQSFKCDETVEVFIAVPSSPNNTEARNEFRERIRDNSLPNYSIFFVIAQSPIPDINQNILNESRNFKDILILDFIDSYEKLGVKVYASMRWMLEYCSHAKYMLKTDDDTLINVRILQHWIANDISHVVDRDSKSIFGKVARRHQPMRRKGHRWYIPPSNWPHSYFPYYCNGATYLLTTTALTALLLQTPFTAYIPVEDALFTGILRHQASVAIHDRWQLFGSPAMLKSLPFQSQLCDLYGVSYLTGVYLEKSFINQTQDRFKKLACSQSSWFYRQKSAQNGYNLEMFFG